MPENPIKLNQSNKEQLLLHDKIVNLYNSKKKLKEVDEAYKNLKVIVDNSVEKFMKTNGYDAIFTSFQTKERSKNENTKHVIDMVVEKSVRLTNVVRRKVIWDADAIETKLGKKKCEQFIDRKYYVNDWSKMVEVLKQHGIKPSEFIPLITVEKTVNEKELERQEELGIISMDDLKETYTVKEISSYIQLDEYKNVKK